MRAAALAAVFMFVTPPVMCQAWRIWPPPHPGPNFCHWEESTQAWEGWTASNVPCAVLMEGKPHK